VNAVIELSGGEPVQALSFAPPEEGSHVDIVPVRTGGRLG